MNTPFFRTETSRPEIASRPEKPDYTEVLTLLEDQRLQQLIDDGQLTYAMIRPQVGPEANQLHLDDVAAAEAIEENIEGLGVLAKFSFVFDDEGIEEFYEGPAKTDSMMPAPPLRDFSYANRWLEFKDLMCDGPATALLLYGDNAIEKWRAHLGHWNIEKYRDPSTIRGTLGIDNHNNLVHGSDSPESAKRELAIIRSVLERQ